MKNINWIVASTLALLLIVIFAFTSGAFSSCIIESEIDGAPGFRFEKLQFNSDHITFDIVNKTNTNVQFRASMSFVDIRGRVTAKIDLLPQNIAANSKAAYKSYFVAGSAETARRCDRILWKPQVTM